MKPDTMFDENDIRPTRLMQEKAAALEWDRNFLRERAEAFVEVNCPACLGEAHSMAFEKLGFQYQRCSECRTIYMSPRPPAALLGEFYAQSKNYAYWNEHIFPATDDVRREKIFRPRVDRLVAYLDEANVRSGVLIEVGGGFGTFAEELRSRERFDRILVIEPTPELAATCRRKGLEVVESTIESVPVDTRADVVVAFEVVEHLFSPLTFIEDCRERLNDHGLLVLSCPSALGFDVMTLGAVSNTVDHEHLNYFNPWSLSRLLAMQGFEVRDVQTPGKLDAGLVRNRILSDEFDVDPHPFLKEVLIERWEDVGSAFQSFLAENLLSSHLWVVAEKSV